MDSSFIFDTWFVLLLIIGFIVAVVVGLMYLSLYLHGKHIRYLDGRRASGPGENEEAGQT